MPEGQGMNNNERMKLDSRIGSSYKMRLSVVSA
jgi:hypothetical protein